MGMSIYGYIYLALCLPTGKGYVGQTISTVASRWKRHVSTSERSIKCLALHSAIRKYHADSFTIETLDTVEECDSAATELNLKEEDWIFVINTLSPNGYNLTTGGDSGRPSDETRAKMSASGKVKHFTDEHRAKIGAAGRGRHHTLEARSKISKANARRITSDETRAKRSVARKGKRLTPETRAKLSAAGMGRIISEETRSRLREAQRVRVLSDEARKRMSGMKGKHHSAETRAKISATKKAHFAIRPYFRMGQHPPMPKSVAQVVLSRGIDVWGESGNYSLHHAIISKADARKLPDEEYVKIHDPRNLLVIPYEANASHAQIPTRELAVEILSRHYGFDKVLEWYNSIQWRNDPPFQLTPPDGNNG